MRKRGKALSLLAAVSHDRRRRCCWHSRCDDRATWHGASRHRSGRHGSRGHRSRRRRMDPLPEPGSGSRQRPRGLRPRGHVRHGVGRRGVHDERGPGRAGGARRVRRGERHRRSPTPVCAASRATSASRSPAARRPTSACSRSPAASPASPRSGDVLPLPDDIVASVSEVWGDSLDGARPTSTAPSTASRSRPTSSRSCGTSPRASPSSATRSRRRWTTFNALVEQMTADGNTPLCVGIESDDATGWPFTDWVEELVLRNEGIDFYNQWVAHEVPFNSPEIVADVRAGDGAVGSRRTCTPPAARSPARRSAPTTPRRWSTTTA